MTLEELATLDDHRAMHYLLRNPTESLLALLNGPLKDLSSLEIARRSGVPSTTIRSLTNRQTKELKVSSWATLTRWALGELRRRGCAQARAAA